MKSLSPGILKIIGHIPGVPALLNLFFRRSTPGLETELFGLHFTNPLGIGGTYDSEGSAMNLMDNLGFGFVEIESPSAKKLYKGRRDLVVAVDICSDKLYVSPEELKEECDRNLTVFYDFADIFVINLHRQSKAENKRLQSNEFISDVISQICNSRLYNDTYKPILLKLSPDASGESQDDMIDSAMHAGLDGIMIAPGENMLPALKHITERTRRNIITVACGIKTPLQAKEALESGASLVEIGAGFELKGPGIVKDTIKILK